MNDGNEPAPLDGIQVLDFGQYVAGPAAAMLLADLGAEIIRVDPPDGPRWDSAAVQVLNRNKQNISLNLKDPADRVTARELVARADVLVENFRPGVMARLELGPQEMRRQNPGLVYLSLPGFSGTDPERAHLQAWEGVVAASVGQFTDMGLNRVLMGIDPSFSPLPLASSYAAVLGALSAVLALRAREQDGQGDFIEVPLAASLAEGLAYNLMHVDDVPCRYLSLRERELERRRGEQEPLDLSYDDLQEYLDAFYRSYFCSDERPFQLTCVSSAMHPVRALKLLGIWEEAQQSGVPTVDPYLSSSDWPDGIDCTIFAHPLSADWNEWLSTRIAAVLATKPASHWEQVFGEGRVPAAAHRTTQEWLHEAHPNQAGLIIEVDDARLGPLKQPGKVAWLEGFDEHRVPTPAAPLDSDRERVLARLQTPRHVAPKPSVPDRPRAWLADVTILDMANVIAGPTIAGTLARFGPRIIKLDPLEPTFDPWNTILCGLQTNRGKQSLLANIKEKAGADLFRRLVAEADVVTINCTADQQQRLGLARDDVASIDPDTIVCRLDTWGGTFDGPWSQWLGYDDTVQAATGITARFGGGLETPEEHAHFGTIDVLGGHCGALAVAAALFAQSRGAAGSTARTSLAAAGQLIQIPFMLDYPGRPPFDEPSGRAALGYGPCYRCYQTRDGWIFLACSPDGLSRLFQEFSLPVNLDGAELADKLAAAFRGASTDGLLSDLWQLDVGAARLEHMHDLRHRYLHEDDSQAIRAETLNFGSFQSHPSGHAVELIAPCAIRPERAPIVALTPAPKYGAHTDEILAEIGFDRTAIDSLREQGLIGERWSDEYLPS